MKTFYLVGELRKKHKVTVGGVIPADIEMNWAHGMVGVMPVFEDRELAEVYAKDAVICEIEIMDKVEDDE